MERQSVPYRPQARLTNSQSPTGSRNSGSAHPQPPEQSVNNWCLNGGDENERFSHPQSQVPAEDSDEALQRLLRETAGAQAANDSAFENEMQKALAVSAQELTPKDTFEDDLRKALAASTQENHGRRQTEEDFESQIAQAMAASRASIHHKFQSKEEEEAVIQRLMKLSASEFYQRHKTGAIANDDDEELQAVLEKSKAEWYRATWQESIVADPEEQLRIDLDPYGKGKGSRRETTTTNGLEGAMGHVTISGRLSQGSSTPSTPSDRGKQSVESTAMGALRTQQDATYAVSLTADREKARRKKEA
ncbi:hypothetical protein CC78DRAFT_612591 [Lojkania enalia]|uniref:Uncharacterized protein n=1 Tax=Lojkania enalia TaxID=147567 RepID=A0A9P4TMX8_9PLEO|nr:hypothetical protein CC78DRAFT_612591 [Didymosphaeria enalia]